MDPGAVIWYSMGAFLLIRGLYMFAQIMIEEYKGD